MAYIDDLKAKIATLEYTSYTKEAEISLLLAEKEDTLRPSIAMFEMATILMEMLIDNQKFIIKHGKTVKAVESREKLLKLMDLRNEFDKIASQSVSFKTTNKLLHGQNVMIGIKNAELKKELETYHATTKEL